MVEADPHVEVLQIRLWTLRPIGFFLSFFLSLLWSQKVKVPLSQLTTALGGWSELQPDKNTSHRLPALQIKIHSCEHELFINIISDINNRVVWV